MTRLPRVLLCLAALWLVVRPAAAQEKQYELSNFDVTVQVRPDGSYEVEETLTYDYQQGTFTYAYRVLDAEDVEAIRNVRVTSPNTTVDSVRRVGDDEGVRVRWTYPERSAPATFRIRYVVEGALFEQGDRNLMYRDVLDAGATVSTHDVDVRVALPAAFDLTPGAVSVDPDEEGTVQRSGGRIVAIFHRDQMNTGDEYPVEVSFPKRLPGQYSPTSGDLLLGLFLFLFGAGGGLALNLRWKRPRTEREAVRPPPDVSLSEGAILLGTKVSPLFMAVLFDLARRGHLTLQHDEEDQFLGTNEVVRIDLHPTPGDLSAVEAEVVQHLDGHETIGDALNDFGSFRRELYRTVRQRVVDAGWIEAHRTRSTLLFVGAIVVLVGGIAVGLTTSGPATVLAVGTGLGGALGALFAGGRRHTFTEAGARRAGALRSFLHHEKGEIDRLLDTDPVRAAERIGERLPWLVYHDDVSSAWLEEVKDTLSDAPSAPELPPGFDRLIGEEDEAAPTAAFVPIMGVMGAMESSGAGAAGAATGGTAGTAGGAAGGGAAGAG
jgi:hypothetical protein